MRWRKKDKTRDNHTRVSPQRPAVLRALGEDLHARLRHRERVLVLRGPPAVRGDRGPPVRPRHALPASLVHHRLNRERHARRHFSGGFVPRVVRHVRRAVEQSAYAVPAEVLHHPEPVPVRARLDRLAQVAEPCARRAQRDGVRQAFARATHQRDGARFLCLARFPRRRRRRDLFFIGTFHKVGLVQVPVVPVQTHGDVQVDDVPVLERARVGYAVAHGFVHRRAERLGETHVVARRRVRAVGDGHHVAYPVEEVGGDPRRDRARHRVHDVPPQTTRRAHLRHRRVALHLQLPLPPRVELLLGPPRGRVVGQGTQPPRVQARDRTFGAHQVRAQRPGPRELRRTGRTPVVPRAGGLQVIRPTGFPIL
mmetsp:Transcript_13451/g.56500  ORF Transcript_13451/g.56500 Transcript_13451/m.56500 type:complete len:367 (+) Transcript_13451:1224-2324(+)